MPSLRLEAICPYSYYIPFFLLICILEPLILFSIHVVLVFLSISSQIISISNFFVLTFKISSLIPSCPGSLPRFKFFKGRSYFFEFYVLFADASNIRKPFFVCSCSSSKLLKYSSHLITSSVFISTSLLSLVNLGVAVVFSYIP